MNPLRLSFTFFILIMGLQACDKNKRADSIPDASADYFLFGRFNGECIGEECVNIFLMQDGKLYEDTSDQYPHGEITPDLEDYILLSDADYAVSEDILLAVPSALYIDSVNVFGCPDCHDQGGFIIQIQQNSATQFFLIDNDTSAIPSYLWDFVDTLRSKVYSL